MSTVDPVLPHRGDGVTLRRLSTSDLPAFQTYRTDADLGRYQGWAPTSDAAALAFLEDMSHAPLFRPGAWVQVGIAEPETSALLGDMGLHLAADGHSAEIGFTLARHAQGRGHATAAVRAAIRLLFEHTSAQRIVGVTDARNHASVAVLERAGLRRHEERTAWFRGESCLEYVYAVTRDPSLGSPLEPR